MKTAILFMTHIYNKEIEQQIQKLYAETKEYATLYVVYQGDKLQIKIPAHLNSFPFTIKELNQLEYKVWGCTLINSNVHFVPLNFFRHFPNYDNYWLIEYDVRFNGNYNEFFSFFEDKEDDFISAHIETVHDNPNWPRWNEIEVINIHLNQSDLLKSFNPICRLSNRALHLLNERCRLGDRGHYELLWPTLFKYYGLKISDFGGTGRYIYKDHPNLFYRHDTNSIEDDKCTHRFRPEHTEKTMITPNMIYHPIK